MNVPADDFVQSLPREALSELQLYKFRRTLGPVLNSNEFYRSKLTAVGMRNPDDVASFDDYRKLPFTTKAELVADQLHAPPYGRNLTFPVETYCRIHQTSGTTGRPLMILDDAESWAWWVRCWEAVYRGAGITSRDRIFFAFSFGPFIGFWSAHAAAEKIGALAIPGGGMSSLQRLQAIATHGVTVLVCTPTYALHLAEVAREDGIDIAGSAVHTTIHAGEPGASLPSTRKRIQQAWGARCYDHAGATEVGAWGFEVRDDPGLYLNEGEFIFEVVDPQSGQEAREGELIITNLGRAGMPVVRYRTGDHVRLASDDSRGSLSYRKLDGGIIGRVDNVLVVRGINVYPSAVEDLLRKYPYVGEFAVDVDRQHELDVIGIRIEVSDDLDAGDVERVIAADFRDALQLRPRVTVVPFGTLPRFDLKARRFNDHRPT
jgi:phenylacetate-CoA ligase